MPVLFYKRGDIGVIYIHICLTKMLLFPVLVAQSRQAATWNSPVEGNIFSTKSCKVLAKLKGTQLRRSLEGKKEKCQEKH
jgi:hypothetical protein